MPSHKEVKNLNHSARQILDLVLDIENYPKFLPWCIGAKITKIFDGSNLAADLVIGFKGIVQKYSSEIEVKKLAENNFEIRVVAIDGPFKNLLNLWHIKALPGNPDQCAVDFFIDFEFSSKMLNLMIGPVFARATDKMIQAFEQRAFEVYHNQNITLNPANNGKEF